MATTPSRRSRADRVERLGKLLGKERGHDDRLRRLFAETRVFSISGTGTFSYVCAAAECKWTTSDCVAAGVRVSLYHLETDIPLVAFVGWLTQRLLAISFYLCKACNSLFRRKVT